MGIVGNVNNPVYGVWEDEDKALAEMPDYVRRWFIYEAGAPLSAAEALAAVKKYKLSWHQILAHAIEASRRDHERLFGEYPDTIYRWSNTRPIPRPLPKHNIRT